MLDVKQLDQDLSTYIRPGTFPIAIRLCESLEEAEALGKRPARDLGIQVAICQTMGMARRYGWPLVITIEDVNCPLTWVPFGFAASVPFFDEGHACAGVYTATPEAGARTELAVPRLPRGKYPAIAIAPLHRTQFAPHVVAVYGNSAQVMRLVQGANYEDGGGTLSVSTGRIDCSEIIIRTFLTQAPHYILPCTGDRMFGLTADDEMVFAMPAQAVERVMAGVKATHKAGIRYPIPTFLRFQPVFPPQYEELGRAIKAGEAAEASDNQ